MNDYQRAYQLPALKEPEIIEYLSSPLFKGIGRKTASTLVGHFGTQILSILEEEPELLAQVPGLGTYRLEKIAQAWSNSQQDPVRGAIALLLVRGISFKLTLNICEYYGHQTEEILRENPYQLIKDLNRVGFKTADQLALSLGISPDSDERYLQAVVYVLSQAKSEGHCFLPYNLLFKQTLDILYLPEYQPSGSKLQKVIAKGLADGELAEGELSGSIYLTAVLASELRVASALKQRLEKPKSGTQELVYWLEEYCTSSNVLSAEQKEALLMAQRYGISILTGGPGRGKTYVLKTLVQWLYRQDLIIALAAPTGKAANRMQNMTGYEAQTIHRLLQWQGTGKGFLYNQQNPLPVECLIIDEFSMVDIFLFNSLLKAIPPHAKVLVVGDAHQLPSIGAGMVLRDLLLSEVLPTTQLTTVFRQDEGSSIISAADLINQGQVPCLDKFTNPEEWLYRDNCSFLEASTASATANAIGQLVRAMKEADVDLNHQLVVLAPQKKGVAGVHKLNKLLQPIFNPPTKNQKKVVTGEVVYRVGDRVIQLQNRYNTSPPVMNGESGTVIDVDPKDSTVTIAFSEGAVVKYAPGLFEQIMHSFAMTCHKAQGSEFQYVIMPLLMSNRLMLTRQLLYTTVTRAQSIFIAVGQSQALEFAVATNKPARRYTQLTALVLKQFEQLSEQLKQLHANRKVRTQSQTQVTIASRIEQRSLNATKGQMTSIGSLALSLYQNEYGHRPCKQFEQIGSMRFKTYHYPSDAVELIDRAIDTVLQIKRTA